MANPFDQFVDEPPADENPFAQFVTTEPRLPPGVDEDNPFYQFRHEEPLPESGQMGAPVRGAVEGAAPSVGGLGAGLATAGALAPVMGPWAMVPGLAVGMGAGALLSKGQDWLLDKLGLREGQGFFSREQALADEIEHPSSRFAGEMAPSALLLRPGGNLVSRAIGAGIGGVAAAGSEYLQEGKVDPAKALMGAGMGAAFPSTNRLGSKFEQAGANFGGRFRKGGAPPESPQGPTNPDVKPDIEEVQPGIEGEVLPPEQSYSAQDAKFATEQRDQFTPESPMWKFWNSHVEDLLARTSGKGSAGVDVDARLGPHGDLNDFTYHDSDYANDITTTAKGVAAENPPAPQIAGAGNPTGAPMEARIASRPTGPLRDYRKGQRALPAPEQSQETVTLSQAPIHEDIQAALATEQPAPVPTGIEPQQIPQAARALSRMDPMEASQLQRDAQQRALTATRQRAESQQLGEAFQPDAQDLAQATQRAMRRPIVKTPMPSGANSSRDPNGPVYIDPRIPDQFHRPLAVHETVEADLMARGAPYEKAHEIATQAERRVVGEKDWASYSEAMNGYLAKIEQEKIPPGRLPPDLHVNPDEAIGHHRKGVTAEVTPQERKIIDYVRNELKGMPEALAKFDTLPPKEQAARGARGLHAAQSETGQARGTAGEVTLPRAQRKLESGVGYRSKADAARKQGATDAIEAAVAKFGAGDKEGTIPTSVADKKQLIDRLQKMYDHATELNGGKNPLSSYRPRVKPPSWTLLAQAERVLKTPTPAAIRDYFSAEKALSKGNAEAGMDFQQTKRIESDIAHRPQIEGTAAEALIHQGQEGETPARPEHEPFTNEGGEESAQYTIGQNRLRDWLNGLSEDTHARLMTQHPDLELNVKTTQDPIELMRNLMDDLAETSGKRPGPIELVPAEDVKGKPVRIRNKADLDRFAPHEPGDAASPGRALDKNSPEFKRIAEQALKNKPTERTTRLEQEEAAAGVTEKPIDGTEKAAWEHFADMMSDESGAVPLDKFAKDAYDWMKQKTTDFFSPAALDPIKEYGNALGFGFTKLSNKLTQFKGQLLGNARSAQFADGTKPNVAEKGQMYRAWERGELGLMPAKLRDYFDTYVKPLEAKYGPMYDEYRVLAKQLKIPGWDDLPTRQNNGNGFMSWVPRIQKGKQAWDHINDNYDPVTSQSLSSWAGTVQPRDWFTLQNTKGQRLTYIPGDGEITIMRNGAPTKVPIKSNSFDPKDIGSTVRLKVKGSQDTWTVDHASIDEITAAGGKTNGVPNIQFHDSPVIAMTNALYGLNNALERLRLYRDIVDSPAFKNSTTRSSKMADELGWKESKLPQFKGVYMPEQWAWAMDDFVKQGLDFGGAKGKAMLDRASTTFAKLFYFFGPAVHALNEADKWTIGRGFNWVTPQGWRSLVENGAKAVKSVHTQDAIQQAMVEAGANPMMMHTVTRDLMRKVARATGDDIAQNQSRWDPFARAFGVSTKDLATRAYDASSKAMWWASDVMATQRFLEEKQLRGLSDRDAAKSMHDFIDSYRMPTTVLGSRLAKQFLSDPTFSLFGPYHYGVFHSLANMAKNLVGPNASMQDRQRAAGQWAVAAAMMFAVYPMLSAGYRAVTGNENAEFERRGMSRLMGTAGEMVEGKKPAEDVLRNVWTPSVTFETIRQQFENKDWRGKQLLDAQDLRQGKNIGRMVGQEAEFLAGQLVSPYKTISNAAMQPDATAGSIAKKFGEGMVGLKTPSDASVKRQELLERIQNAAQKSRNKRPGGLIEHGVNKVFE